MRGVGLQEVPIIVGSFGNLRNWLLRRDGCLGEVVATGGIVNTVKCFIAFSNTEKRG